MFCEYLLQMAGATQLYKTQIIMIDNWRAKIDLSSIHLEPSVLFISWEVTSLIPAQTLQL